MNSESAVQFDTNSRIHMGLVVGDLEKSIAFYRTLFGQEPDKVRPRYAKFEVADPPLNISLNETGGPTEPSNPVAHFGIQHKTTANVKALGERLTAAGHSTTVEEKVACCYAVQSKVWVRDPDGNKWEIYVLLDNNAPAFAPSNSQCCQPDSAALMGGNSRQACDCTPGPSCCQ